MTAVWNGVTAGPDGRLRCPWALSAPEYLHYHDTEWGRPVTSVPGLYERMTLEAFQSGLSWLTILRKRENFRAAFDDFQPERVAGYGQADVERLMSDAGIVRNLSKIRAAISNARIVSEWGQGFVNLIWSYQEPSRPRPRRLSDVPPTTAYAMMQAVGLVDDHLADCFVPLPPAAPRAE